MKPEKQRIAIAEACGWTDVKGTKGVHPKAHFKGCGYADDWIALPDYLHDLNAMHKAEKVIGYVNRLNYPAQLFDVVCRTSGEWQKVFNKIHPDAWALQATSAQRAEAFLRTIGKWEEEA
jgi:hypothetical protein